MRGRVENYQNNLQFIIEQFWPAKEGTFDIGDLLPHTTKDIPPMCREAVGDPGQHPEPASGGAACRRISMTKS